MPVAWIAVASLSACNGTGGERTTATVPTATTALSTSTTVDPYAVPAVIDEAYVNRVLAGLDAAVGDVVRLVVKERALTPEAVDRLKALYADLALEQQLGGFRAASGFSNFRSPPGDRSTKVLRLITTRSDCLFAEVTRDFSEVVVTRSTMVGQRNWVALRSQRAVSANANPTNWVTLLDEVTSSQQPIDPCDS